MKQEIDPFDPETSEADIARKKKEQDEELQYTHDLEWLLNTPQGVRFVQKIIVNGGTFDDLFFGNSKDAFAAGKRSFSLKLWKRIYQDFPEKAVRILQVEKPKDPEPEDEEE